MSFPGPAPIIVPDARASSRFAWMIVFYTSAGLALLGVFALVPALFTAFSEGTIRPFLGVSGTVVLFMIVMIVAVIVLWSHQSALTTKIRDTLTLAGHPGVDAKRLLAGRRVASPAGYFLALRRERNESGRWLRIDPVP